MMQNLWARRYPIVRALVGTILACGLALVLTFTESRSGPTNGTAPLFGVAICLIVITLVGFSLRASWNHDFEPNHTLVLRLARDVQRDEKIIHIRALQDLCKKKHAVARIMNMGRYTTDNIKIGFITESDYILVKMSPPEGKYI